MPIFVESLVEIFLKYWKIILPVILVIATIIGSFLYGYHKASAKCEAEKYRAAYQQVQVQLEASQKEVAQLKVQKDKIHVVTETQIKEVPKYIPDNRACDVGPDAIRLLNNARNVSP